MYSTGPVCSDEKVAEPGVRTASRLDVSKFIPRPFFGGKERSTIGSHGFHVSRYDMKTQKGHVNDVVESLDFGPVNR